MTSLVTWSSNDTLYIRIIILAIIMDLSFRSSSDKLNGETSKLATTSQEKFERIFLNDRNFNLIGL
jgi:hypothetical protein